MKELKLEVGKTYRSREGEEVKIVERIGGGPYQFEGSNGECYTERGIWRYFGNEDPEDLIEEVKEAPETLHSFGLVAEALTATRYTFDIPEGVKRVTASQEGNRIVVEMVPEDEPEKVMFKEGDVVFKDGRIMIVKKHPDLYHAMFYTNHGRLYIDGTYGIPFTSENFRIATTEEAQPLWDALKKAGKRWNAETMQVEDVPERERIMGYLKDYENNSMWNHEQLYWLIKDYLAQKEDEKMKSNIYKPKKQRK